MWWRDGLNFVVFLLLVHHAMYVAYLRVNSRQQKRPLMLVVFVISVILFCIHFMILAANQDSILYMQQKLYRNWIRIDCLLIVFEAPFLKLYNFRKDTLINTCLLYCINMAQSEPPKRL